MRKLLESYRLSDIASMAAGDEAFCRRHAGEAWAGEMREAAALPRPTAEEQWALVDGGADAADGAGNALVALLEIPGLKKRAWPGAVLPYCVQRSLHARATHRSGDVTAAVALHERALAMHEAGGGARGGRLGWR